MPRAAPRFVLLIVVLAASGCSGIPIRGRVRPRARTLRPRAIAVYPYAFRFAEPPWHAWEETRAAVDAVLAHGGYLVYGPGDFQVLRRRSNDVLAATDLITPLTRDAVSTRQTVALRPWAEERVQTGAKMTYDAQGRPVGQVRTEVRTLVAHLEVISVQTGRVLLQGRAKVRLDPFADLPDWDPLRPLTRANRALVAWALGILGGGGDLPTDLGATLVENPGCAFSFHARPGDGGSAAALARLGPLDRDAARFAVYRYFDAELPPRRVHLYTHHAEGVMVRAVTGVAAASGLKPGDLVVEVDGRRVLGPEMVRRAWELAGPAGIRVTVIRDGGIRQVRIRRQGS